MKILGIVRHGTLFLLVLTSVPMIRHYILDKPHHEHIVHLHIAIGILFVILSITATIMNKMIKKNKPEA